jgi:UDP-N-acetylmuramoylalanine-D-glutamate ligase
MKEIKIDYKISQILNILYNIWVDDRTYYHSFNDYLLSKYKIVSHTNTILTFENEKDYTWFLLNV